MIRPMMWFCMLATVGVTGCGGDKDPTDTGATSETGTTTEPEPGPGAFAADWDSNPDFFTAMAGPTNAGSVHGTVQIWYSTNIQAQVDGGGSFTAPDGTVSIKTTDDGAGNTGVVVMIKQAGSDADNGDWFYEMRGGVAPYDILDSGAIQMCIDCHQGFPDTDYLGGTALR